MFTKFVLREHPSMNISTVRLMDAKYVIQFLSLEAVNLHYIHRNNVVLKYLQQVHFVFKFRIFFLKSFKETLDAVKHVLVLKSLTSAQKGRTLSLIRRSCFSVTEFGIF